MKRQAIAAAVLSLALSATVFAAEATQPSAYTDFEQIKANHLKKLEERISILQEEKSCMQSAKNRDDLNACRFKHREEMKKRHGKMGPVNGFGSLRGQSPSETK